MKENRESMVDPRFAKALQTPVASERYAPVLTRLSAFYATLKHFGYDVTWTRPCPGSDGRMFFSLLLNGQRLLSVHFPADHTSPASLWSSFACRQFLLDGVQVETEEDVDSALTGLLSDNEWRLHLLASERFPRKVDDYGVEIEPKKPV